MKFIVLLVVVPERLAVLGSARQFVLAILGKERIVDRRLPSIVVHRSAPHGHRRNGVGVFRRSEPKDSNRIMVLHIYFGQQFRIGAWLGVSTWRAVNWVSQFIVFANFSWYGLFKQGLLSNSTTNTHKQTRSGLSQSTDFFSNLYKTRQGGGAYKYEHRKFTRKGQQRD